jgi:hypothetical protein
MFNTMIKGFRAVSLAAGFLAVASVNSFAQELGSHLDAVPPVYNGQCPATITFNGWIAMNRPGSIRYRFVRSDGGKGPFVWLKFEQGGQQNVSTTWRLGGARLRNYRGWEAIQIVYPRGMVSNHANFQMSCGK